MFEIFGKSRQWGQKTSQSLVNEIKITAQNNKLAGSKKNGSITFKDWLLQIIF